MDWLRAIKLLLVFIFLGSGFAIYRLIAPVSKTVVACQAELWELESADATGLRDLRLRAMSRQQIRALHNRMTGCIAADEENTSRYLHLATVALRFQGEKLPVR